MNGMVRGHKTRATIPGKDGKRAGDLLNRDFTGEVPNRIGSPISPTSRCIPTSFTGS